MDVSASTTTTATGSLAQAQAGQAPASTDSTDPQNAATALTSDFETFLRMLTTQMQNQDPLDPMKSDQFAQQLAAFSGVEQQVLTNDLLRELSGGFGTAGMANLAGWVGMEVKGPFPVVFDGQPVTLHPSPAARADRAELVVRDAAGTEVQRLAIPVSDAPIEWAGVGLDGTPLAAGSYSFEVESYAGDEAIGTTPVERYAKVSEALSVDGTAMLRLTDGAEADVSGITAVRDPDIDDG